MNPIQDWGKGGGSKKVPYQFFSYNFYKQELAPKTFWHLV